MEDLKQIQEFFSKPLEENKVTKEDFNKVVKVLSASKYPFTIMLVPKWGEIDIITGQDSPNEIVDDIGQRLDSAGLNWGGNSGITISGDSSNYSRREYSDIFRVNGGHKDYFEESVNEMDMNDPIMMKMRAAKDKLAKMRAANAGDDGNDKFFDNAKKIAFLKKERAQLMRDMEQEAEPEGGPIADEYGSKLNRIDAAIAKLSGRKEMTYDQAIAENDDKIKDLEQQLDFHTQMDNKGRASIIKDKIEKLRKLSNSGKIDGDEFLDKFNPLQKQLKAIAENDSYVRVSEPKFIKDKNNPNFLYVNFKYDTGSGVLTALGKETMAGQIRRLSSAEAMKQATALAKDIEAKYNLEDIDVYDKENGVVQIFAVSDDFINMNPNMLSENKMPTQDQVDKFFALTQNETHYLNSKPVKGQEKTFNLMPIEPWDEYDLSNWNSLVRKAKQQGKLSEDKFKPHMMYDPKTGKGYKANKKEDHERMDKMGYTHEKPSVKESISQTLAETIKLGEGVIEEELCPKGKAYIKRRKAAGEKSSAYLSGRAVKVCKGQMSGRKKKK